MKKKTYLGLVTLTRLEPLPPLPALSSPFVGIMHSKISISKVKKID
jgi:hypothetical protein